LLYVTIYLVICVVHGTTTTHLPIVFIIVVTHTISFVQLIFLLFSYVFCFAVLFVYGTTVLCFTLSNFNLSVFNMYFNRIIDTHNSIYMFSLRICYVELFVNSFCLLMLYILVFKLHFNVILII
jgi:hypothetical protein